MAASSLVASPVHIEDLLTTSDPRRRILEFFSKEEKPIRLFVATVGKDSSMLPLEVCKSDTIACVKRKIQADQGISVEQQRLVYAGKELRRGACALQDYGIQNGAVLHLVLLIPMIVSLTLRTVDGNSFVYKVWQAQDAKDLHKFTPADGPLPLELPIVISKGKQPEDLRILKDFTLKGQSVWFFRVHKPNARSRSAISKELDLVVESAENVSISCSGTVATSPGLGQSIWPLDFKQDSLWVGREEQHLSYGLQRPPRLLLPSIYPLSFDLPNSLWDLFDRVKAGLRAGQAPRLTTEGSGGVYVMKDEFGRQNMAVFKPMDEEPMSANNPRGFSRSYGGEGLRRGTRSGEGAIREVAAYVLDHPAGSTKRTRTDLTKRNCEGFSRVPPTTLVRCCHDAFQNGSDAYGVHKAKAGSLQQFVPAISSCEDMGSSLFPIDEVHRISVLDLRLANTDRNGGNILVCEGNDISTKLVPIDHGYCLPDKFEDCSFEWLYWPQAQQPYMQPTLEYIKSLDADEDISLLVQCGWSMQPQVARNFRISTMVLKKGAAAGFTPFEIGSIMSRNVCLYTKSTIELIVERVEAMNLSGHSFVGEVAKLLDELFTFLKQG